MRDFKKGDKVKFEVLEDGHPRWSDGNDRSNPNNLFRIDPMVPPCFVEAEVWASNATDGFLTRHDIPFGIFKSKNKTWHWPQPSNKHYPPDLFAKPGYISLLNVSKYIDRRNNDGRKICLFCGGETRSCGGLYANIDYRICKVCGR